MHMHMLCNVHVHVHVRMLSRRACRSMASISAANSAGCTRTWLGSVLGLQGTRACVVRVRVRGLGLHRVRVGIGLGLGLEGGLRVIGLRLGSR